MLVIMLKRIMVIMNVIISVLAIMVKVIMVIRNLVISASDYEGNENENDIAVKMMAIQRMTPVHMVPTPIPFLYK